MPVCVRACVQVEVEVEEWYELIARALRQNLVFIIILCSSLLLLGTCTYLMCRYCSFCPLYRRKLHNRRMRSMEIGQRA